MPVDYTTMTDPSTGKPFASQDAGQAWSNAMAGQSQAAGNDSGVKASDASLAGTGAGIDWSKTGWNINYGANNDHASDPNWYKPPSNDYGFQIGNQVGYFDPTTGKMTVGDSTLDKSNPTQYKNLDPTTAQSYTYAPTTDYGLGSTALGIIPLEHNNQGQVSVYLAPGANGGFQKFSTLADAQASVAAYNTWKATTSTSQGFGAQPAPTTATTTAVPTSTAPTPTYNDLSLPGAGETNWNETKDLYRQPTNAQKLQDSLAPPGTTNAQKVFDETPNQPSAQEQQWNAYSGIYGDPHYLDDYYQRAENRAQTTLDRKAASGGWGDSGAAAKATGNLGAVFADRALTGMGQFATTGMGLAGASDAGRTQRTQLQGSLGAAADSANNSQLSTRAGIAGGADTANLAQLTGGQSAAHSAQTDQQNRVNGGIDRLTQLGNDQAALTAAGFSAADAELFSTQLATMQGQWTAAGLTAQQQYQKAQELMQTLGIVGNSAANYYLSTRFGLKTSTPYQPVTGPMPAGSQ